MKFNIHVYVHPPKDDTAKLLSQINNKLNLLIMKEAEAAQALVDLKATLEKINAEVQAKLDALADAIAAQDEVSPEVQAALSELQIAVKGVDDLIPDEPTPPVE